MLIAADDLDAAVFLVRGEQGEVLKNIEDDTGPKHVPNGTLHIRQRSFGLVLRVVPGPPNLDGHADGAVAVRLSFRGKGEYVGHEHLRDAQFVAVVDIARPVHPGDRRAHRGLGLADHQRQPVDQKHHVEPPASVLDRIDPLVGGDELVSGKVLEIDQPHRGVFAALPERHGLLAPQPFGQQFVCPDKSLALNGQRQGAQPVQHLVGAVGIFLYFGVEPDQGVADPRLHEYVRVKARHVGGGDKLPGSNFPAVRLDCFGNPVIGGTTAKRVEDHLFDGVFFVKHEIPPPNLN